MGAWPGTDGAARVVRRSRATTQARSLNPAIITTGGLKNWREVIGEYTARVGYAATHFGAEFTRKTPRQLCGCRDLKWRQSSEPVATAALG
ncbi:hypothetical protein NDU88_001110 [Pleurodeles waltl]|uniref:Uncharacterized protein n=1 Tax=Pleurodeles waltl TaxID=8319 RepID=A0AAV7WLP0_PLEWA|nr:hypothetical protein NDU88_001110 [Pleurodeles waltl]